MASAQRARTQDLIPIKSIKNGIVQLKDGSLRKVILVDGTNFDLKSEQEQYFKAIQDKYSKAPKNNESVEIFNHLSQLLQ